MGYSGTPGKLIQEKTRSHKSCAHHDWISQDLFAWHIEQNHHCLSNGSQNNLRTRNSKAKIETLIFGPFKNVLTFFTVFSRFSFLNQKGEKLALLWWLPKILHPGRENFVHNFSFLILNPFIYKLYVFFLLSCSPWSSYIYFHQKDPDHQNAVYSVQNPFI